MNPCYHPRSCRKCAVAGTACGLHAAGDREHQRCTGTLREFIIETERSGEVGRLFSISADEAERCWRNAYGWQYAGAGEGTITATPVDLRVAS